MEKRRFLRELPRTERKIMMEISIVMSFNSTRIIPGECFNCGTLIKSKISRQSVSTDSRSFPILRVVGFCESV